MCGVLRYIICVENVYISLFYYIIITITIVKNNELYIKIIMQMVAKEALESLLCWLPWYDRHQYYTCISTHDLQVYVTNLFLC